jgi:hypothetical protein
MAGHAKARQRLDATRARLDTVKKTRHPWDYDYLARFPNARMIRGFEGSAVFAAETPFMIHDQSMLGEFLEPDDRMLDGLIVVIEFENEAERLEYVLTKLPRGSLQFPESF